MSQDLERLIMIVKKLRAPDGCEWDNTQTSKSLTPYLLEEVYEVIEAIETEDINLLKEEFQIKFFVGDDALANSFLSIRPAK